MKLSHFHFNLPEELLAEFPAENRDESRLMVVHRKTGLIEHKMFKDLIDYFDDGYLMLVSSISGQTDKIKLFLYLYSCNNILKNVLMPSYCISDK